MTLSRVINRQNTSLWPIQRKCNKYFPSHSYILIFGNNSFASFDDQNRSSFLEVLLLMKELFTLLLPVNELLIYDLYQKVFYAHLTTKYIF